MNREIEMKQHVLKMLKEHLLGEEGKKFKPKAIEVEMVGKPKGMKNGGEVYDTQGETGWPKDKEMDGLSTEHNMHETEGEDYAYDHDLEKGWAGHNEHMDHPGQFVAVNDAAPNGWANTKEKNLGREGMADGGLVSGNGVRYDTPPGGWAKDSEKRTRDSGTIGGRRVESAYDSTDGYDYDDSRSRPGMKDGGLVRDMKDSGYRTRMGEMEGGFEDMDLEHVEGSGYEPTGDMEGGEVNKKAKKMSLKEFLAAKSQ